MYLNFAIDTQVDVRARQHLALALALTITITIPQAKVDVWALGCILHALCFREHPFGTESTLQVQHGQG